jgi:16S rRNA (cytidine1402-2'-O)-methyltransferase
MADAFGERVAVVARELTKLHEEFREGALSDLAADIAQAPPKGEIVVLVHPPGRKKPAGKAEVDSFLREALGAMSVRDAAAAAADALGVARKEAYERALRMKAEER